MSDLELVLKPERKPILRVEIARSFSYKLNVAAYGGPQYESRDFFCSEKAECDFADAAEVSAMLYAFCRAQVMSAVKVYIEDMEAQRQRRKTA